MKSSIVWLVMAFALELGHAQGPGKVPRPLGALVDVGGYRVHLYCTGSGSPTVIVTGAGASFDWALVQPEVARFTRVCTYDHSGTAWSDPGPKDSCRLRVDEIRHALKNAGISGPYVLVGHSLGALVSRLYAAQFEKEVAGVVIVDHASIRPIQISGGPGPSGAVQPRIPMNRDPNWGFEKLPERDYKLHLWATSLPTSAGVMSRNVQMTSECEADVAAATQGGAVPLRDKPLIALGTRGSAPLHMELAKLSNNGKLVTAEDSGHYIMIDRPDLVIASIREVVESARTGRALPK